MSYSSIETTVADNCLFFPRGINFTHVSTAASKGASVTWSNCVLALQTGAAGSSVSIVDGILPLYLNQEPWVTVTLNAAFAPPTAGVQQLLGMGGSESGVFVGYNGLDFGLLNRSGGKRQHWVLQCANKVLTNTSITLILMDTVHTIAVTAGMDPIQVLQAVGASSSLVNANIQCFVCFDRVTLYTTDAFTVTSIAADSIDFGSSGLTGTLVCSIVGVPSVDSWLLAADFNAPSNYALQDIPLTNMNVFEFKFCRWSTGSLQFSMLNTHNDSMSLMHRWSPEPTMGFNTSLPYHPHVRISNDVGCTATCTLRTSMASISSGTPSTTTNRTNFSTTFVSSNISVVAGVNTVIGVFTNPIASAGIRNRNTACINSIRINCDIPRSIRVLVTLNGTIDTLTPTQLHLPWSCIRHAMPAAGTTVVGGLPFANLFIRDTNPDRVIEFSQLWLVPGSHMSISITSAADPVTVSLDADVSWSEV